MDTKLKRVVPYEMQLTTQKISSHLVKRSFHSRVFFHIRIVPLILHRVTIRLILLVKEKELPILIFLNFYVA